MSDVAVIDKMDRDSLMNREVQIASCQCDACTGEARGAKPDACQKAMVGKRGKVISIECHNKCLVVELSDGTTAHMFPWELELVRN